MLAQPFFQTNPEISAIGKNFNGFIQGMKFLKGKSSEFAPLDLLQDADSTQNLIWFFSFTEEGLRDKNSFTNLKRGR